MHTGLLTTEICEQAWGMILPAVETTAEAEITNKFAGTIFVLNPTILFAGQDALPTNAVLYSEIVGETEDEKYTGIAEDKAYVSWKTGLPSRIVQQQAPHLLATGMTKWGGSVVRDGLVVAFSGVQAVFDEMISGWMADTIIALCRHEMTKPGGVMASDSAIIESPDNPPSERTFRAIGSVAYRGAGMID
jgi:hypothetical protein